MVLYAFIIFRYPTAVSSIPILVSDLACDTSNPSHLTIYHCPRSSGFLCNHSEDVALICASPYSISIQFPRLLIKIMQ